MEQPNNTPTCCGKLVKWVQQTPSLAYFYCPTCKTEPSASAEDELLPTGWLEELVWD